MYGLIDAFIRCVLVLAFLLLNVLFMIWALRKFLGHIQMRLGPMRTGWHGWLQSVADAIKLLSKEDLLPENADRWAFQIAPVLVVVPAIMVYVAIPFTDFFYIRAMELGLFYIMAISSFSILGFIIAGWGSANKYALLGAARSGAQLVSYELPLVLAVLGVAMVTGSLNLMEIVQQQSPVPFVVLQPLGLALFITAALAEVNQTPFDIPVSEQELVGGLLVEYSGIRWGFFYFSEFINVITLSALAAILFLGGWSWPWIPAGGWAAQLVGFGWFIGKVYGFVLLVFWLRGTLPRLRVDQLMTFAWRLLIPLAFLNLFITGLAMVTTPWILALGWLALLGYFYAVASVQGRL